MIYDLAVVGGGPAGLSAAVQARVRGKSVLIVSGDVRDNALYKAQRVDNYLGLPETGGGALLERFRRLCWLSSGQRSDIPYFCMGQPCSHCLPICTNVHPWTVQTDSKSSGN